MKVPAEFRVGSATHTGLVRGGNEDDYLLLAPPGRQPLAFAAALADGMGGIAGGAEASRTGLRGFAAALLAAPGDLDLQELAQQAVAAANARVREQAQLVPSLREMGTTLTALIVRADLAVLAHVGDSRAYRLRDGVLQQLSVDHTKKEHDSRLLRCIGGGLDVGEPDLTTMQLQPGDRFLLCSDGVWGTVPPPQLLEALQKHAPAAAADRLVGLALAAGGPDNATAVVVHYLARADGAPPVEIELPAEEAPRTGELRRHAARLGGHRWPWVVAGIAILLLLAVAMQWLFDFDVVAFLRSLA